MNKKELQKAQNIIDTLFYDEKALTQRFLAWRSATLHDFQFWHKLSGGISAKPVLSDSSFLWVGLNNF